MGNLVGLLISNRHQWAIRSMLFALAFAMALGAAGWFTAHQVGEGMRAHTNATLEHYLRLRNNVVAAFEALRSGVTAEPCTTEFYDQLRRVAFLPDGLNEFVYMPGGVASCALSSGRLAEPMDLGPPDIAGDNPFSMRFWIDRNLDFLRLNALQGTFAAQGDLGLVVPNQPDTQAVPRWLKHEIVLVAPGGERWWHRNGEPGIYKRHLTDGFKGSPWPLHNGAFNIVSCDPVGLHCVAAEATLANLFAFGGLTVAAALVICALLGAGISAQLYRLLRRHWSFEARFRRHFGPRSLVCCYQPIMNLRTGAIVGCEVLARWRDVDGRIVFPDEFLPLVERHGLSFELTRFVVTRAETELSTLLRPQQRLQVNFNISPRDLDARRLSGLFQTMLVAGQLRPAVEIVETDQFTSETAQHEIAELRRRGIQTYLDDFGTGFSNIQNLAALTLDGVKLDRAFAMASDDSLMGKLLPNALAMLQQSGRVVVVEGVETEERLEMLRATGQVDFVQGYLIARPMDAAGFGRFLAEREGTRSKPRLVA